MKVFKLEKVIAHMKNGVNVKQNKNGVGDRLSRIETISDGNFNFDKVGYAELSSDQKSKYKINKNDILFSHINSLEHLGKTAIYEANQEMYHGVNLLLIRANDLVLPKYLRYFFIFLRNSGYWISNGKQAINQASVNQTDIKNLQIPVPSLEEQEKIVEKLDKIFGKVDHDISNYKNRLIEIGNLFNSTFHSTFANTGDEHKEFFLEDCIKHQRGLTFKKSDVVDYSDLKVLRSNNIDYEKYSFIKNDFLYLNPKIQIEDKYFTEKNDIIVCMSTGSRKHLGKLQ